jgi:hypothetical protein
MYVWHGGHRILSIMPCMYGMEGIEIVDYAMYVWHGGHRILSIMPCMYGIEGIEIVDYAMYVWHGGHKNCRLGHVCMAYAFTKSLRFRKCC